MCEEPKRRRRRWVERQAAGTTVRTKLIVSLNSRCLQISATFALQASNRYFPYLNYSQNSFLCDVTMANDTSHIFMTVSRVEG